MSQPIARLEDGDNLHARLLAFGNSLRPVDVPKAYFCQIVTELIDASLMNYRQPSHLYAVRGTAARALFRV